MERDTASVLADIKKYEDTLARDPGSYCFAPLAELYRKQGLLDEAIGVANRGCDLHPDYVGGYLALGRAYYEKGQKDESRSALEKVVTLTPDNLLALRLLSHLYAEQGDTAAAEKVLRSILSQSPEDMESQALLDSLIDSLPAPPQTDLGMTDEIEGMDAGMDVLDSLSEFGIELEDAEIIEELTDDDLIDDDDEFVVSTVNAAPVADEAGVADEKNPISTVTLAELYVSQGFSKHALTIYRELLETDPDNADLRKRLYELKRAIDEDAATARNNLLAGDEIEPTGTEAFMAENGCTTGPAMTTPSGGEDRVVETLEKWLENIRGRR